LSFAKFSSDGQYVLFTSDMNGSGRSDVFLAEVPTAPADAGRPALVIVTPREDATVKGAILVLALAKSKSVDEVVFRVDGQLVGHRQPHRRPHLLWLDTRTLTNGLHTITAVALSATDVPLGSDSVHVTVANPLPRVQIRTPRTNATVKGTIEIEASMTSPDNVASLSFEVDGRPLGQLLRPPHAEADWNTTTVPNGRHTLRAVVTTRAGATSVSEPITVVVSNPMPTIKVSSPKGGATVKGRVDVEAAVTERSRITRVEFRLDGAALGRVNRDDAVSWDTAGAAVGSHTLSAVITTTTGEEIVSAPVVVTVKR